MADLLVIEFDTEAKAEELRQRLLSLQKEYVIELADAVIAVKCPEGRVKLNQLFQPVKAGAVSGALWGTLIGLLFLMPLAGAAVGAATGALGGRFADAGINDQFMRQAAAHLQAGKAGLFLLIRKMTTDKILGELRDSGGIILRSSFDETKEEALRKALSGIQAERAAASPADPTLTVAGCMEGDSQDKTRISDRSRKRPCI